MRLMFLLFVAALAGQAQAADFADPGQIDRLVAEFAGAGIGAPGGARMPVDRTLRLTRCPDPLALDWYGTTRDTVLVRCPTAGGWRLFVPMAGGGGRPGTAVVNRGDEVTIAVKGDGFVVSRQAAALEGGAVGDWIRVRPVGAKGDPLRVRVLDSGHVGLELQ